MKNMLEGIIGAYKKIPWDRSANIWILAIMTALVSAILLTGEPSYQAKLNEGDISANDIYAPYNFTYPGAVDEAKTNELKEKALIDFLPVYDTEPAGYWDEKRKAIAASLKNSDIVKNFAGADITQIEKTTLIVIDKISPRIIADDSTIEELISNKKNDITVLNPKTGAETKVPRSDLCTKGQLKPVVEKELALKGIEQSELQQELASLIVSPLIPSLVYDKAETEARRKAILEKIEPVYAQILVKKNELIIGKARGR